jgi:arsenate reductase
MKRNILFVCIHNSARSQMAEAFLNQYGNGQWVAESAGIEKGKLNPYVVKVMAEAGIDISQNQTTSVGDKLDRNYDAVVTVCDAASAEACPVFPGNVKRLGWSFADPSRFTGTEEEILEQTRKVRDEIRQQVLDFINEAKALAYWS